MAQSKVAEATEVAKSIAKDPEKISFKSDDYVLELYTFEYGDTLIQAHRLPDSWQFVGFDENWFSIELRSTRELSENRQNSY